jgi:hypothetical protein
VKLWFRLRGVVEDRAVARGDDLFRLWLSGVFSSGLQLLQVALVVLS